MRTHGTVLNLNLNLRDFEIVTVLRMLPLGRSKVIPLTISPLSIRQPVRPRIVSVHASRTDLQGYFLATSSRVHGAASLTKLSRPSLKHEAPSRRTFTNVARLEKMALTRSTDPLVWIDCEVSALSLSCYVVLAGETW